MKLKVDVYLHHIIIYGATNFVRDDPIVGLWFAWQLGKEGVKAHFYSLDRESHYDFAVDSSIPSLASTIIEKTKELRADNKIRGIKEATK